MLIDTHCHLEMILQYPQLETLSEENYQAVQNIIDEAEAAGVTGMITIGTTYQRCIQGMLLAQRFEQVYATVGLHPCDLTDNWREELQQLATEINNQRNNIIGIGETGLDFYHPGFNIEQQKRAFHAQIELALAHNRALVVHSRHAIDETLEVLQTYQQSGLRGVVHCFSEQRAIAYDIQKLGLMIGIGGIITYPKNEYLREIVREIGLANIVLETDAPFLPPQHMRGKQNRPAHIRTIAQCIAEIVALPLETVAATTTANARRLFKI